MMGKRVCSVLAIVLWALLLFVLTGACYAQKQSTPSAYQEFNRWGIIFEYPKTFTEWPQERVRMMKEALSRELTRSIEEGLALCGERSLRQFTFFVSSNQMVALMVWKLQFTEEPSADCLLRERKLVLEDAKKANDVTKIWQLEKTQAAGHDAVREDVERSNDGRGVCLHILAGKIMYDLSWIVNDKSKFGDWGKELTHLVNTLRIPQNQDLAKRTYKQTKIAFCSYRNGNWDIYVMNADGSKQTRLTKDSAIDAGPFWSPDGKKIAFISNRNGNSEIYVMNADGTEQINLTDNSATDVSLSWSPDGKRIAFASDRDGNMEIYVMNVDGTDQKRLIENHALDSPCSWSPDGKKIAFMSDRDKGDRNVEIYVMNIDGSQQERLTRSVPEDRGSRDPRWSPDGSTILFSSNRDGNSEIYVMNADGSKQKRLTDHRAIDAFASWSPDGNKITFTSERDGKGEIYIMNADGSEPKRLTNNLAIDAFPCWSPFIKTEE